MLKVVCFHNPDEINGFLSNWYLSDFVIDNVKYSSVEQYMMYWKARTFNDKKNAEKILAVSDVGKIKSLGRSVENYNNTVWNGLRQIIVYKGLLEKFRQDSELREKLLATENNILAECAVNDKIWGIGLSMNSEKRFDINEWKGENLLGFSLMCVREELRK